MARQEQPASQSERSVQSEQSAPATPVARSGDRFGSVLILTGVILLVLVAAGSGWLWWSQRDERAAKAEAVAVAEAERQAIDLIHRWARVSVEARRALNPDLFAEVYVPGSELDRTAGETVRQLERQGVRAEVTRVIRSVEVKESSRDRVVAVVVWEEPRILFKDVRTGELVQEAVGMRRTTELEIRLIGGRWYITENLRLKAESLFETGSTTGQVPGESG